MSYLNKPDITPIMKTAQAIGEGVGIVRDYITSDYNAQRNNILSSLSISTEALVSSINSISYNFASTQNGQVVFSADPSILSSQFYNYVGQAQSLNTEINDVNTEAESKISAVNQIADGLLIKMQEAGVELQQFVFFPMDNTSGEQVDNSGNTTASTDDVSSDNTMISVTETTSEEAPVDGGSNEIMPVEDHTDVSATDTISEEALVDGGSNEIMPVEDHTDVSATDTIFEEASVDAGSNEMIPVEDHTDVSATDAIFEETLVDGGSNEMIPVEDHTDVSATDTISEEALVDGGSNEMIPVEDHTDVSATDTIFEEALVDGGSNEMIPVEDHTDVSATDTIFEEASVEYTSVETSNDQGLSGDDDTDYTYDI